MPKILSSLLCPSTKSFFLGDDSFEPSGGRLFFSPKPCQRSPGGEHALLHKGLVGESLGFGRGKGKEEKGDSNDFVLLFW